MWIGKKGNCNILRQEFCVISSEIDKGFLDWILTLNQSFVNRNVWNAQIYNCIHSSKLTIKSSKQYQNKTEHSSSICKFPTNTFFLKVFYATLFYFFSNETSESDKCCVSIMRQKHLRKIAKKGPLRCTITATADK